jgi:hypothetical protein
MMSVEIDARFSEAIMQRCGGKSWINPAARRSDSQKILSPSHPPHTQPHNPQPTFKMAAMTATFITTGVRHVCGAKCACRG